MSNIDPFISRQADLNNKRNEKTAQLRDEFRNKITAFNSTIAYEEANIERNKDSWVSQEGLVPGTAEANTTNLLASMEHGTARLWGDLLTGNKNTVAEMNRAAVNPDAWEAYNRTMEEDQAMPGDYELLFQKTEPEVGAEASANRLNPMLVEDWKAQNPDATSQELAEAALAGKIKSRLRQSKENENAKPIQSVSELRDENTTAKVKTNLESIVAFKDAIKKSKEISDSWDKSGIVHDENRRRFQQNNQENFKEIESSFKGAWNNLSEGKILEGTGDLTEGVAKFIGVVADTGINDPQVMFELMAENAPQLGLAAIPGVGTPALMASTASYAYNEYRNGVLKYMKDNAGQLPPPEMDREARLYAASLAVAEFVGDKVTLGMIKGPTKGIKAGIDAVSKTAKEIVSTGAKGAIPALASGTAKLGIGAASGAAKAAGGVTVSSLTEGVTEGWQGYAETKANYSELKEGQVAENAVMGALAGKGFALPGAAMDTIKEALGIDLSSLKDAKAKNDAKNSTLNDFAKALETKDVSVFTDKTKPETYDLNKAAAVYFTLAAAENTPPEEVANYIQQVDSLLIQAEEDKKAIEEDHPYSASSIAAYENAVKNLPSNIAAATDPAAKAELEESLLGAQEMLDDLENGVRQYEEAIKKQDNAISRISEMVARVSVKEEAVSASITPEVATATITSVITSATDPNVSSETKAEEANKLVDTVLQSPQSVTITQLNQILSAKNTGLSPEQLSLLRVMRDTRVQENKTKDSEGVTSEIVTGILPDGSESQNESIRSYRQKIGNALVKNREGFLRSTMRNLSSFAQSHADKATKASEAYDAFLVDRKEREVYRDAAGGWFVRESTGMSADDRAKTGTLLIKANSPKLVKKLQNETQLLSQFQNEMQLAIAAKQGNAPAATPAATTETATTTPTTLAGKIRAALAPTAATASVNESAATTPVPATVQTPSTSTTPDTTTATTPVVDSAVESQAVESAEAEVEVQSDLDTETTTASVTEAQETTASENVVETDTETVETAEENTQTDPVVSEDVKTEPTGLLTTLQSQKTDLAAGTLTTQRNAVADTMLQSPGKEGENNTRKPLVMVKDFMTSVRHGAAKISQYVKTKTGGVSPEQQRLLNHFFKTHAQWSKSAKSLLIGKDAAFRYEDVKGYLLQLSEDGQTIADENLITAIVYSVYSYLAEQGTNQFVKTKEQIADLLGVETSELTEEDIDTFWLGLEPEFLAEDLGKKIIDALGLKATPDTPANLLTNMRVSLGLVAEALMHKQGLVTRRQISAAGVEQAKGVDESGQPSYSKWNRVFIKEEQLVDASINKGVDVASLLSMQGVPVLQQIVAVSRNTQGLLNSLFGAQSSKTAPRLSSKGGPVQKKTKAGRAIPKRLQKIIASNQTKPWTVRQVAYDLLSRFDTSFLMGVEGVAMRGSPTFVEGLAKYTEVRENSLATSAEDIFEFMEDTLVDADGNPALDTEFYLDYNVNDNNRVQMTTGLVNPQNNKMHRILISQKGWKTSIDIKKPNKDLNKFQMVLAEALGMKIDKSSAAVKKDLREFLGIVDGDLDSDLVAQDPVIRQALDALKSSIKNETWTEEQTRANEIAIVKAVEKAGEAFQSLSGLMALAQYEVALESGQTSFETTLAGEIDGVTNGPQLTMFLYGIDRLSRHLLTKGGFFFNDKYKKFSEWKEKSKESDLYQTVTGNLLNYYSVLADQDEVRRADRIQAVMGRWADDNNKITSTGRNLTKKPLTMYFFGSGMSKILSSMGSSFAQTYYERIQGMLRDFHSGKRSEADVKEDFKVFRENVNVMLRAGGAPLMPDTLRGARDTVLSLKQLEALSAYFQNTMKEPVKHSIEITFPQFEERKKAVSIASEAMFTMYNTVKESLYAEALQAAVEATGDVSPKGIPLRDLTPKEKAEVDTIIEKLFPTFNSAYTANNNTDAASFGVGKTKKSMGDMAFHKQKAKFPAKTFDSSENRSTTRNQKADYAEVNSFVTSMTNPGVALYSYSAHSSDSFISHTAQETWLDSSSGVLNLHDALASGIGMMSTVGQNLNKQTWEILSSYSPMLEMYKSFMNTLKELEVLMDKETSNPEEFNYNAKDAAYAALAAVAKRMSYDKERRGTLITFFSVASDIFNQAREAQQNRRKYIETIKTIDQYAHEDSAYEITQKERDAKLALLEDVSQMSQEDLDLLERLKDKLEEVYVDTPDFYRAEAEFKKEQAIKKRTENTAVVTTVAGLLANVTQEVTEEELNENATPPDFQTTGKQQFDSKHDGNLVRNLLKKPKLDRAALLSAMSNYLGTLGKSSPYFNYLDQLVKVAVKGLPPGLNLVYVHGPQELEALGLPAKKERANGMYDLPSNTVYVYGAGFTDTVVNPEVVVHEVIHAGTAHFIAKPNKTPEEQVYVDNLLALLDLAKKQAKAEGKPELLEGTQSDNPLIQAAEFASWGLSNPDVIELLKRTKVPKGIIKGSNKGLTNAWKEFLNTVASFLGFSTFATQNALAKLLQNVAAISSMNVQADGDSRIDSLFHQTPANKYRNLTTEQIYDALEGQDARSISGEFGNQLKNLLSTVVANIYGEFGSFKDAFLEQEAITGLDVYLKALYKGKAAFASKVYTSNFKISDREGFVTEQVEATVREALKGKETTITAAYKELTRLYNDARKALRASDFYVGDWSKASPAQQAEAQAKYDFVFKVAQDGDGKIDYISRFAALGLGLEEFNKVLHKATDKINSQAPQGSQKRDIVQGIRKIFNDILRWLREKRTHTYAGQPVNERLAAIVDTLVDVEAKQKRKLASNDPEFLDTIYETAEKASTAVSNMIDSAAQSGVVQKSKFAVVRGLGNVVSLAATDRLEFLGKAFSDFRNSIDKGRTGVLAGMLNYVRGSSAELIAALRASKQLDQSKMDFTTKTAKFLLQSFSNQGKDLTDEHKAAIASLLRTDAQSLLDTYSWKEIDSFLSDPVALQLEIDKQTQAFTGKLSKYNARRYAGYFDQAIKNLGYYLATGSNHSRMGYKNIHNLIRMWGTPQQGSLSSKEIEDGSPILERLVSLQAMQYMDSAETQALSSLIRTEVARETTDGGNGFEVTFRTHRILLQEAKDTNFVGEEHLMEKGYVPNVYNQHNDVIIGDDSVAADLVAQNYVQGPKVPVDPADPDKTPKYLFKLEGGGMLAHPTGIFQYQDKHSMGTDLITGSTHGTSANARRNRQKLNGITNNKLKNIRMSFARVPNYDPSKQPIQAFPIFNQTGTPVNYHYQAFNETKDAFLERDNRFELLLGSLGARTITKQKVPEHNNQALKLLYEDYAKNYGLNPDGYAEISAKSSNPEFRELWSLLPEQAKKDAEALWGEPVMFVKQTDLDTVFAYREFSLSSLWDLPEAERNMAEKLFIGAIENLMYSYARGVKGMTPDEALKYQKRSKITVRKGEDIWKALVRTTKDIVVIRTGFVMIGNIWSNITLLRMNGVPMYDALKLQATAWNGIWKMRKDEEELFTLKQQRATGVMQKPLSEVNRRILELEDAINRNPVKELVDKGMLPTIAEDVSVETDIFSYQAKFDKKIEATIDKLGKPAAAVVNTLLVSKNTPLYKFFSQSTQVSDFVARYALYTHLTTRKRNPMSPEAALHEASENFVNYDIPLPKSMQYLDSMGVVYFTKYFFSIQRVLYRLLKDHPLDVALTLVGNDMLGMMPTAMEAFAPNRFGNPIELGPLKLLGVIDETAPMSLIKTAF